jgi:hypothetical protein
VFFTKKFEAGIISEFREKRVAAINADKIKKGKNNFSREVPKDRRATISESSLNLPKEYIVASKAARGTAIGRKNMAIFPIRERISYMAISLATRYLIKRNIWKIKRKIEKNTVPNRKGGMKMLPRYLWYILNIFCVIKPQ